MNVNDVITQLKAVEARREGQDEGADREVVVQVGDSDYRLISGVRFKAPNLIVVLLRGNEGHGGSD